MRACGYFLTTCCDEEEGHRAGEIKLLSNVFISSGYDPKDIDRVIDFYVFDKQDKDKKAERRTDAVCIPYVRGSPDRLRKQLAKEGVCVIFKRG